MLERIRHTIGIRYSQVRLRKKGDGVIQFSDAISRGGHFLVVLPFNDQLRIQAKPVLEALKSLPQVRSITVVTIDHAVEAMRLLPKSHFIRILKDDINTFYVPKRRLMERIRTREYDMAIDLSLDFMLPAAYIVEDSGARIRVGVSTAYSDLFFNFQIRTKTVQSPAVVYEHIAHCLKMF